MFRRLLHWSGVKRGIQKKPAKCVWIKAQQQMSGLNLCEMGGTGAPLK